MYLLRRHVSLLFGGWYLRLGFSDSSLLHMAPFLYCYLINLTRCKNFFTTAQLSQYCFLLLPQNPFFFNNLTELLVQYLLKIVFQINSKFLEIVIYDVLPTDCKKPLGMENGRIKDSQITASSTFSTDPDADYFPHYARLNLQSNIAAGGRIVGGWAPDPAVEDISKSVIQVDLGSTMVVTMVATQGRAETTYNQFTSSYVLSYSVDRKDWKNYLGNCVKVRLLINEFPHRTPSNVQSIEPRPQGTLPHGTFVCVLGLARCFCSQSFIHAG